MNIVFRGQERKRLVRAPPPLLPGAGEDGRREEGNGLKE